MHRTNPFFPFSILGRAKFHTGLPFLHSKGTTYEVVLYPDLKSQNKRGFLGESGAAEDWEAERGL